MISMTPEPQGTEKGNAPMHGCAFMLEALAIGTCYLLVRQTTTTQAGLLASRKCAIAGTCRLDLSTHVVVHCLA